MSFLSDLFSGNFSGLGQDLTSQVKQIGGSNTLEDLGIGAALVTGGLGLAGVGPAAALGGLLGATDAAAAGTGALGVAGGAAGVGAGATDLSALGAADLGLGLVPGSLDALSATGTTAGDVGSLGTLPGVTDTTTGALTSAPPVATSAANFAAPQGVTSTLGIDPTAANAGNSIDAAAGQPGVNGAPGGGFWSNLTTQLSPANLGTNIGSSIGKNLPGLALAAGGLGYDIYQGQKESSAVQNLNAIASQQAAEGQTLENYLNTGTLPAGLQAGVTQAVQQAKAAAISNMASQGLSTDPTKNSALASELAAIDNQVPQLTAQIGEQLLSAGQAATGLSSSVYSTLANIDQTQTAAIGKAIASMAAALSGKTGVNVGGLTISGAAA